MNQDLNGKKITIFGGSGFIGNHLISSLCKQPCQIEVVTRKLNYKSTHFFGNEPGQLKYKSIKSFDEESLNHAVNNSDVVINLIGILYENKKNTFDFVHSKIPYLIAKSCNYNKVRNLIHLSALNVEKIKNSKYALSKFKGEKLMKDTFKDTTIIRPGVVFGKGDNFINFFYKLSKISPFLPIIGTPDIRKTNSILPIINFEKKVKFQPVYVSDLVKFIISKSLTKAKVFEIAGPEICSFDQIFDVMLNAKSKKRFYLPVPFFLATSLAFILEKFPHPLLTRDQIKLLKKNNISPQGLQTLKKVEKNPTSMKSIIGSYI